MGSKKKAAFAGIAVISLAIGASTIAPALSSASISPNEKLSIGTISKTRGTATFSARGTIDNIINNGQGFIMKVWERTFTVVPHDTTRFSPSVRDTSAAQRLAAYGIGDEVQVYGYVSSSTLTVAPTSISNYTERSSGSPLYRVKTILDGTLESLTSTTFKLKVGSKTYNVIHDDTGKYYDAQKRRIKPALSGWASGDSVYGYFMVGGTDAKAVAVYNRSKTAANADLYTTSSNTGNTGTVPAAPTGVSATAGDRQVTLTWNAVTGAERYKIMRSETSGGPYSTVTSYAQGTSYTNTGRTNGVTYYYVIMAVNKAGESAQSAQVSAKPMGTATNGSSTKPATPTGVTATAGDKQVTITWNAVPGAERYKLMRSETSGGPYTLVSSYITSTTYTNTGRTNGKTYYYVVSAVNKAGESAQSAQVSATPASGGTGTGGTNPPPPPPPPGGL